MDISGGSTRVPEHLTRVSVARAGNGEEEQNKIQPCAAPSQTPVRFKIRSAKERQELFTKVSSFTSETLDKTSRSIKKCKEEIPKVHTISPPSQDTDKIDKRRPRALNQLSLPRNPELSIGPETSSTIQKRSDCVESPTTNKRGRTELRQLYQFNRSKSLDWRVSKHEGGQENQTDVISNAKDLEGRSMRRSESLERNDMASRANSNELVRPLKRVSLRIQPFNGPAQRKQDSSGVISSAASGTSPVRTVALAQSFPSRIKVNQSQDKTEERKNPLNSGNSGTMPDKVEHHLTSHVDASKVNEITRNQTVMGKNGHTASAGNSEGSPTGVFHGIVTPTPFFSVQATDSNSNRSEPTRSSLDRSISVSSLSKMKTVSYKPEKSDTFPKAPFKKGPDTSLVLPNGKDNLDAMSKLSKEKPLSHDSTSSMTNKSVQNERRLTGNFLGLGTQSLGRTRHRYFTSPISFSAYGLNNSNSIQKSTKSDTEIQEDKTTSNPKLTKSMETTTLPGKDPLSTQEGVIPRAKPQSPKSMTGDSKKHYPEHGVGLEFASSGSPDKKYDGLFEKVQEPSLSSVQSRIHKFEALAQQSQSPSGFQHPRRAFSVIEKPKVVPSLNKTYSDRSLGKRLGDWNRDCLKENLCSKVSDEAATLDDLSGPVQTTTQDKEGSTVKAQSKGAKSQEHGVAQIKKQPDESPSDQKNEKFTTMNKNVDEPDSSKGSNLKSYQKFKNIELSEDKVRNYLSSTGSTNTQKSSGIANIPQSDLKDSDLKDKMSTKDTAFHKESTSMLQNSYSPTAVKTPSNLISDSGLIPSIQAVGDFNNPYNTLKDEKLAAKVIRWIMDKGADDENGEDDEDDEGTERGYDSDSGESSITITSNMSSRSFCMRYDVTN